jgi:membrane protease YdiL (CAAX protease family)
VGPWIRDHAVVAYVALAFGFSWAYWLPMVLAAHGVGSVPWSSHVPGLIGPMLAAAVVTSMIDGRAGLNRLIRSGRRMPSNRWLLVALSPFALLIVAVLVTLPATGGVQWSDFGRFDGLPSTVGPIGVLLLLVVVNGFGEEAGWRGFLQPTLQHDESVKTATLTVTAIWALWHTPLFLLDDGLGEMPLVMIPVWVIGLAAGSVVLAWLYNHTSSVLAVALWHGTYNWAAATKAAEPAIGALVTAGVIAAALILVRREPLLGSNRDPNSTAT